MKDKERDIFDDLFRSKLQDFEADTMPGDWEAIADRLPVKKTVPFRRTLRYWGAAAVISLLVVTGGVYVFNRDREHLPVAETIQKETEAVENRLTERSESVTPAVVASKPVDRIAKRAVAQVTAVTTSRSDITVDEVVLSPEEDCDTVVVISSKISEASEAIAVTETATLTGTHFLFADADRLPVKKTVPFRRTLRYWGAAAVISLLVVTGGVYVFNRDREHLPVAETIQKETEAVENRLTERSESVTPAVVASKPVDRIAKRAVAQVTAVTTSRSDITVDEVVLSPEEDCDTVVVISSKISEASEAIAVTETATLTGTHFLFADAAPVKTEEKKVRAKRWSFGMGGGSVSAGTSNSLNAYALKNTLMTDQELLQLNSPYFNSQSPKTNIRHKTPVSIGLGVSYSLNDRFSLQSGLNYTFLSSEWETGAIYHGETKQKLHFIGIPLSLSYKIAEWKCIQFYAAAGAMTEINVAGKLNAKIFVENNEIRHEKKHIRMKEWMWSVNARAGASYPLLRFLSVYAEVGAGYYFDNGSDIETIRSEKPFNVNLQAGFRFGF